MIALYVVLDKNDNQVGSCRPEYLPWDLPYAAHNFIVHTVISHINALILLNISIGNLFNETSEVVKISIFLVSFIIYPKTQSHKIAQKKDKKDLHFGK